ncbi:MAG: L,D-transpeptidase [Selenomonadaceae bacterium]|nr:L,D-transpeptidase [Selenomonadaceae bacterium]
MSIFFNFSHEAQADGKKIVINSASRLMTLYDGDKKISVFPLGLGKTWTPTPVGYYSILTKELNPSWIDPSDPEYEVPSGPDNPLGYRWMQIRGNYGIHGTNKPDSIGYYVSNGCIRMYEKDVEFVYDQVEVGTPVEITYNRVVVEKVEDGNVAYYIYPDGYGWQSIDTNYVMGWLEPYGVSPFVTDNEIYEKIQNSDGQPTYIGKPYNIEVNGQRIEPLEANGRKFLSKAVVRDKITYIPAVPVAMALKTKLEWRAAESTLKTVHGEVTGYEMRRQIYCNADDLNVLFSIDGGLQNISDNPDDGKIFRFKTVEKHDEIFDPTPEPEKKSDDKNKKSQTDQPVKPDKPSKTEPSEIPETPEKVEKSDVNEDIAPADESSQGETVKRDLRKEDMTGNNV